MGGFFTGFLRGAGDWAEKQNLLQLEQKKEQHKGLLDLIDKLATHPSTSPEARDKLYQLRLEGQMAEPGKFKVKPEDLLTHMGTSQEAGPQAALPPMQPQPPEGSQLPPSAAPIPPIPGATVQLPTIDVPPHQRSIFMTPEEELKRATDPLRAKAAIDLEGKKALEGYKAEQKIKVGKELLPGQLELKKAANKASPIAGTILGSQLSTMPSIENSVGPDIDPSMEYHITRNADGTIFSHYPSVAPPPPPMKVSDPDSSTGYSWVTTDRATRKQVLNKMEAPVPVGSQQRMSVTQRLVKQADGSLTVEEFHTVSGPIGAGGPRKEGGPAPIPKIPGSLPGTGRTAGASIPAEELGKRVTTETLLEDAAKMRELAASHKDAIGPVAGRAIAAGASNLPEALQTENMKNPDVLNLYYLVDNARNQLLYALSGKQINETEYKRLSRLVPQYNTPPNTFFSRLTAYESELKRTLAKKLAGGPKAGAPTPTPSKPSFTPKVQRWGRDASGNPIRIN